MSCSVGVCGVIEQEPNVPCLGCGGITYVWRADNVEDFDHSLFCAGCGLRQLESPVVKETAIVPMPVVLANGAIVRHDGQISLRRGDGSLVVREPSGVVVFYPKCPRCHRLVKQSRVEYHMERHCLIPGCRQVFDWETKRGEGGLIFHGAESRVRHSLDHLLKALHLRPPSDQEFDHLIQTFGERPDLVLSHIIKRLERVGRIVLIAKRVSLCSLCHLDIREGDLIEHLRGGSWIHVFCGVSDSPSPTSGGVQPDRADSNQGLDPPANPPALPPGSELARNPWASRAPAQADGSDHSQDMDPLCGRSAIRQRR